MRRSLQAFLLLLLLGPVLKAGPLEEGFRSPPEQARPWTFWYWMKGASSREGITADLEAMKEAGLAGAYLCFIGREANPPLTPKPVIQLTPEWWDQVTHAMREADRLGLRLAFHMSDGFATAGGPWITPELSMQKLTWSETEVEGGHVMDLSLPTPPHLRDYYRDVAVVALPAGPGSAPFLSRRQPRITTSIPEAQVGFLAGGGANGTLRSETDCWVQYSYDEPFTARSVRISGAPNNHLPLRPRVLASDDGENFRELRRLSPPRHGWRDFDEPHTYALPPTTARHFRFIFEREGMEAGSENYETAKWSPVLKLRRLELSESARLDAYEGKSALVWRIAPRTLGKDLLHGAFPGPEELRLLGLPQGEEGKVRCELPQGRWTILRIGVTTTGRRNDTAGGGLGLECDKLNPEAVALQFDRWFGELLRRAGPELASRTIRIFHVDSWECGSQNWSPVLIPEFKKRRGYDPVPFLPAMAGFPIGGEERAEAFLRDLRQTLSELVAENFYGVLAKRVRELGMEFSSECVAPIMTADGLRPFAEVDIPMGEFWLRSPTHDKPNDMADAISGAHIYGKRLIQAEAFTQLRMGWDETPALLRPLADRAFALGINRMVHHVMTHNPWLERRPGMTMGGVGLFFQRDQSWWPLVRGWNDYLARCQFLLQSGTPVADLLVFTGEETPSRALLPSELLDSVPGLFDPALLASEKRRLANIGQPQRELPITVRAGANIPMLTTWTDPLRGYAYDSINPHALLTLARADQGSLQLPGGGRYRALLIPGARSMNPVPAALSPALRERVAAFEAAGVTVLRADLPGGSFHGENLEQLGIPRAFSALDDQGKRVTNIAWTQRRLDDGTDLFFISNQEDRPRVFVAELRSQGKQVEFWDALTADIRPASLTRNGGLARVPVSLPPHGSLFLLLRPESAPTHSPASRSTEVRALDQGAWTLQFPASQPQPLKTLTSWSKLPGRDSFSGLAVYRREFNCESGKASQVWLDLGELRDLARVRVNGTDCGITWTAPHRVDITRALKPGVNQLEIEVANTWHNQLLADASLEAEARRTWVSSPVRTSSSTPLDAGLLGPVQLIFEY